MTEFADCTRAVRLRSCGHVNTDRRFKAYLGQRVSNRVFGAEGDKRKQSRWNKLQERQECDVRVTEL